MGRARAALGEEYRPRALRPEQRADEEQNQYRGGEERHDEPRGLRRRARRAEAEAAVEEPHADADADDEPGDAGDCVPVAARETQIGAPRAAEEDERADHSEEAEREAHHRRRAAARPVLGEGERRTEGPEDEARDFGAQILDNRGAVQPEGPRDVAREAGDAETHVAGVAEFYEKGGYYAQNQPRNRRAVL